MTINYNGAYWLKKLTSWKPDEKDGYMFVGKWIRGDYNVMDYDLFAERISEDTIILYNYINGEKNVLAADIYKKQEEIASYLKSINFQVYIPKRIKITWKKRFNFGKYKGAYLKDVYPSDISYIIYLKSFAELPDDILENIGNITFDELQQIKIKYKNEDYNYIDTLVKFKKEYENNPLMLQFLENLEEKHNIKELILEFDTDRYGEQIVPDKRKVRNY